VQTFLVYAIPAAARCNQPRRGQPILACVATGTADAAEGLMLGELHRAGWKVLELLAPAELKARFPGLKRYPGLAPVMAMARERGVAFLALGHEDA